MARKSAKWAKDIMTRRVEVLAADADVHKAVDTLLKRRFAAAPVTDAHGSLLGMFSEHDCIRVLAAAVYQGWPAGPVSAHMTREVEVLSPDDDLAVLAKRFSESRHRSMPVVQDGKVVGLVGRSDLIRALDRQLEGAGPKTTYELISEQRS